MHMCPVLFVVSKILVSSELLSCLLEMGVEYYLVPGMYQVLLRGGIVIRTHRIHKNLYITLFLLIIFGPYYYVPP